MASAEFCDKCVVIAAIAVAIGTASRLNDAGSGVKIGADGPTGDIHIAVSNAWIIQSDTSREVAVGTSQKSGVVGRGTSTSLEGLGYLYHERIRRARTVSHIDLGLIKQRGAAEKVW